jgi:methylmalonyl-CoA mutase N-terminal domain/subunit
VGKDYEERFGATDEKSWMLRFHTQTAGSTLTAQQPENNVIRVTLQALAAVLGGTQSLHTNSMDEALWLPTEKSVRIALRTQQIIAYESGVADSVDPIAGSYLVEQWTNEIEKEAMDYIQKIDDMGGVLQAIENGYVQKEIQNSSYKFQKEVESKQQVIVGVNDFQVDEIQDLERLKIDPTIEKKQITKLREYKKGRDSSRVSELLTILEKTARSDDNLLPVFIACVENGITLGEITGVLKGIWGEYQPASFS